MPRLHLLLLVLLALATPAIAAGDSVGWRRDGTGIYPQASPPIHWQQISETIAGLRFQSSPSEGDKPSGTAMPDGIIREWLVLGPIPDAANDPLNTADQSKLSPRSGDKVGSLAWTTLQTETAYLDFAQQFKSYGSKSQQAAYAHAYLYSPIDAQVLLNINNTDTANVWVNGKPTTKNNDKDMSYAPPAIALKKGWNRLLVRCTASQNDRPGFGVWYINASLRALDKNVPFESKNIKWKTMLPAGTGFGAPTVVGGKIFLQSEPADLVCLDEGTGKILWVRSNNYDELATDEEKKANPDVFKEIAALEAMLKAENDSFAAGKFPKLEPVEGGEAYKVKTATEKKLYDLMKQVDDKKYTRPKGQEVGYCGFTPVSDGKFVWAWFASGVTCCYDINGNLVWRRLDNEGPFFEHGYSVSPILADGKIIVFMNKLLAFDAKTGKQLWTTPLSGLGQTRFHGTPAVASIAGNPVCILPPGDIVRLSDGKLIHDKGPDISNRQQEIPSPVVNGNTVFELSTFSLFNKVVLPAQISDPLTPASVQTLKLDMSHYPTYYLDWFLSSPLIHDGLAYCVNNSGVLVVIDVNTMQVVYQKLLDLDHFQNGNNEKFGIGISPSLAGENIYLVGNAGTTLVIKPGRTFQQLAKNKIESVIPRNWGQRLERFVGAPFFDGKCMFLRGERYLYCIAEK